MAQIRAIWPKVTMSTAKDIIYILTVVIGVFFYFRDRNAEQAVMNSNYRTMIDNQKNIFEKITEIDKKFEKQAEVNGKVLMYIELDADTK